MTPCSCGGEVILEYFDPVKRPVEWFLRCLGCGAISETAGTREDALEAPWPMAPVEHAA